MSESANKEPEKPSIDSGQSKGDAEPSRRVVLVHYHLFKNAGTSVDKALKKQYKDRWASIEADVGEKELPPEQLQAFIDQRPELQAISSHTARVQPQALHGARIFPIIFLRHPIDRMMSAYEFERKQNADTLGSRKARELSFREYAEFFLLDVKARTFQNFQSFRLSSASRREGLPEVERALDAIESLPFVGVVEEFEASIQLLEQRASSAIPGFRMEIMRANVGAREGSLQERLDHIQGELGPELYEIACEKNLRDRVLWERARSVTTLSMNSSTTASDSD